MFRSIPIRRSDASLRSRASKLSPVCRSQNYPTNRTMLPPVADRLRNVRLRGLRRRRALLIFFASGSRGLPPSGIEQKELACLPPSSLPLGAIRASPFFLMTRGTGPSLSQTMARSRVGCVKCRESFVSSRLMLILAFCWNQNGGREASVLRRVVCDRLTPAVPQRAQAGCRRGRFPT